MLHEPLGVDVGVAVLRAADVQRAEPALVVGRDGHGLEDALDLALGEAVLEQALVRAGLDEDLRARARGHALGADADQPPRAGLARHGGAEQRVDLLRLDARDRRRLVLRVARLDVDLGAQRALAVADLLGDVLGQRLGAEGALAEHDLPDRLVDDFLEAAHMRTLLVRAEIDEAVEAGREQLLGPIGADPDDLLDVGHTHARERQRERRNPALDVLQGQSHDTQRRGRVRTGRMDQGFAKDRPRIPCYKAGTA